MAEPDRFIMSTAREGMMFERERVLKLIDRFARLGDNNRAGSELLRYVRAVIKQGEHHKNWSSVPFKATEPRHYTARQEEAR